MTANKVGIILWTPPGNYQIFSYSSRVFVIKFCVELGENGKETLQLLQEVSVPEALGRHTVFKLRRHLLFAWEMMEEGICFSPCSLKLTTVVQWYLSLVSVLVREVVGVHIHAPETKTEHFWLRVLTNSHLDKLLWNNFWTRGYIWSLAVIWPLRVIKDPAECKDITAQIVMKQLLDQRIHLVTGSNLTTQSDNGSSRMQRYYCPNYYETSSGPEDTPGHWQ